MHPKEKWYLKTWYICLLFMLWPMIIPPIVGVILIVIQHLKRKKLVQKYGDINELDNSIHSKEKEIAQLIANYKEESEQLKISYGDMNAQLENENKKLRLKSEKLTNQILDLEKTAITRQYIFSDYDGLTSEECKNELALLKLKEQDLIKSNEAVTSTSQGTKKEINNNTKQILRCFNSECDNVLLGISVKNIDTMRNRVTKSFETLNKIFETNGTSIKKEILEIKLEELNLVYTFELKRNQEKEQQKAIKEQMVEEEKVRREIAKEKAKLEKDQAQCNNEISKLIQYLQKTENDIEKQLYVDKINELEEKLKQLEVDKATVLEREANARAGYVYIISNIGSFGDDIYKIGMTRRLEPMDRVKELSSASVPFVFDVHAMIFSTDAPALETSLHKYFEKHSVNKVNPRKEFFKVSISEIETFVKENYNDTVEFTKTALAEEYKQSLQIA